jgi:DNA-binding transcriptional ArsR family regulator
MQALPDKGFVWHELMTCDPDQAERFYADVVGIAASRMGEGTSAYRRHLVDWPAVARPRSWRMMAPCWIGRCERGLGVLRLQLNAEDLARMRVSSSWGPFNEALLSLTRLRNPGRDLLVEGWRRAVPGQLWPRMAPLLVLAPMRGLVDLHTVVGNAGSIGEALDRLEGAPDDHLRKELGFLRPSLEGAGTWARRWLGDLCEGDRGARRLLVELVREYHASAIDPFWGAIAARLEAERARCGRTMARHGVGGLLDSLHPKIRWRPPFLEMDVPVAEHTGADGGRVRVVGGRSLVLAPSVFCLDRPWLMWNEADPSVPDLLIYPVLRGLGDAVGLWNGDGPPAAGELARLLGSTRAEALEAVADTCTTTELARRLGVSPATASHHVGALRGANLIASSRDGNAVRHSLTGLGAALLAGTHLGGLR